MSNPGKNPHNDIEAQITFLPTEHGGKTGPAYVNYRPQFYYDGNDWMCQIDFPDVETAVPGNTVRALLALGQPEKHAGKLYQGKPFLLREGQKVVAYGVVTAVLN